MTAFHLHVFGGETASADARRTDESLSSFQSHCSMEGRSHEQSLHDADGNLLRAALRASGSGVLVLTDQQHLPNAEALLDAVDEFAATEAAIGVLPGPTSPDFAFVWKTLPPRLAAFVMAPEAHSAVFISGHHVRADRDIVDSSAPLFDLLVRLALQPGHAVCPLNISETPTREPHESPRLPIPERAGHLPLLVPNRSVSKNRLPGKYLARLDVPSLFSAKGEAIAGSAADVAALHAGLWQIHDFLDESHAISQSIEGRGQDSNGDYWHAIMHRREPDWSNAKYWLRHAGPHPCFATLEQVARTIFAECHSGGTDRWQERLFGESGWNPFAFVDLCETASRDEHSDLAIIARRIQWAEMLLLLEHSCDCVRDHQ